MFHVLVLRYTASLDKIDAHVPDHVTYLERHHADGTFVVSGHTVPEDIGGVILATGSRIAIDKIAAEDPFVRAGVAEYEIVTVDPQRTHGDLRDLRDLLAPPEDDSGWDEAALVELRQGKLGVLGGRPLQPVLQRAGEALLAAGVSGAADIARRCIEELRERAWDGDDVLALELSAELGEKIDATDGGWPPWPLEPVPVSLDDLAESLDGDPMGGSGVIDLREGHVWPPGIMDFDPPEELNEESDSYDPDRWLSYSPESRGGYQDMVDFASTVDDERLRERMFRALDGRGAFRRFRDVLDEAHETYRFRWYLFRDECALGRAREWLAAEGYRAGHR
jgi:uncharacterized protein YciI